MALYEQLKHRYQFRCLDLVPAPNIEDHLEDFVVGDITNFATIFAAMQGIDVVIHLAANPRIDQGWQTVYHIEIGGTYTVLEAARQAGVSKVIYASTSHVTGWKEIQQNRRVTIDTPVEPNSFYGIGKLTGENLGRLFAQKYNLSVICIRIGAFVLEPKPKSFKDTLLQTWCSPRDLAQLVEKCIQSEGISFQIFYGVSQNSRRLWDIENARQILGYHPQDNAEKFWSKPQLSITQNALSVRKLIGKLYQRFSKSVRVQAWLFYLQFYRGHSKVLWISAIVAICQSLLMIPIALLVRYVIDRVLPAQNFQLLILTGLALLLLNLINSGITLWNRNLTLKIVKTIIARLRLQLIEKIQRLSRTDYATTDIYGLHNCVLQETERLDVMSSLIVGQLIPAVCITLTLAISLVYLNPALFLVLAIFSSVTVWVNRRMAGVFKQKVNQFQKSFESLSAGVFFMLQTLDLTKIQGAETLEIHRQNRLIRDLQKTSADVGWLHTAYISVQSTVLTASKLMILIFGAIVVSQQRMTLGELLSFFVVANLLNTYLQQVLGAVPQIIAGNQSLLPVFKLLTEPIFPVYTGTEKIELTGQIDLKSVSFQYQSEPILTDINLTLSPNKITAISGVTGAGKSTLIYLILGFYRPNQGEIYANNLAFTEIDMTYFRRQVGVVLQDLSLFPGTISENIAYGYHNVPQEEMVKAAKIATAHEFILHLPAGYETCIGERGILLSGGQRQRLALARAVLKFPKLLILDEPTNHLDRATIDLLLKNLKSMPNSPTILIISHDSCLINQADFLYTLKNGQLIPSHA
jgi:ABC-type bacteriocin/lantibiotic exporter with double-glycine peptidase domain